MKSLHFLQMDTFNELYFFEIEKNTSTTSLWNDIRSPVNQTHQRLPLLYYIKTSLYLLLKESKNNSIQFI